MVHYCVTKGYVYRKDKQQFINLLLSMFHQSREGQRRLLNKWNQSSETQMVVQTELNGLVCKIHSSPRHRRGL